MSSTMPSISTQRGAIFGRQPCRKRHNRQLLNRLPQGQLVIVLGTCVPIFIKFPPSWTAIHFDRFVRPQKCQKKFLRPQKWKSGRKEWKAAAKNLDIFRFSAAKTHMKNVLFCRQNCPHSLKQTSIYTQHITTYTMAYVSSTNSKKPKSGQSHSGVDSSKGVKRVV